MSEGKPQPSVPCGGGKTVDKSGEGKEAYCRADARPGLRILPYPNGGCYEKGRWGALPPPPPFAHARPCLSTEWALKRHFEEILGPLFFVVQKGRIGCF